MPVGLRTADIVTAEVAPWQDTLAVVIAHDTPVWGIVSFTVEVGAAASADVAAAARISVRSAGLGLMSSLTPVRRGREAYERTGRTDRATR